MVQRMDHASRFHYYVDPSTSTKPMAGNRKQGMDYCIQKGVLETANY